MTSVQVKVHPSTKSFLRIEIPRISSVYITKEILINGNFGSGWARADFIVEFSVNSFFS